MGSHQEVSASSSTSAAAAESKPEPQPWKVLIKQLSSNPHEKLSILEKNYSFMYNAFIDSSKKFQDLKSTMTKNLQDKSSQVNADLYMEHQQPDKNIFQQLGLKKQKLQGSQGKMQSQVNTEHEMNSGEMDLLKNNLSRNEKLVSDLEQEHSAWRKKFQEKVSSITSLAEIQGNNKFIMEALEKKHHQLKNMSSQMQDVILHFMSVTAPDDDTPKTTKEEEVEIMRMKLKKILDELLVVTDK